MNRKSSRIKLNRRQFLGFTWVASIAALLWETGAGLLNFFSPRTKSSGFGGLVKAGLIEEFPPGSLRHIPAGQFYISHIPGDGLLAMWHRCTHLGCTVPWKEEENQFNCPCHSSFFDRTGQVTGGPAPRPLDLFSISIEGNEVIVDTNNAFVRQRYDDSQTVKVEGI